MKKYYILGKFPLLSMLFLVTVSCDKRDIAKKPTETLIPNSLQTIKEDMTLPHESHPHGVPSSFHWYNMPHVGAGNNPPNGYTAMLPWGQVYCDDKPVQPEIKNTRVHLRNLQAWYLSKQHNVWKVWTGPYTIGGAHYYEDFRGDYAQPASIRKENDGGISIMMIPGFNFHFWTKRVLIDPSDIDGIWIFMQARLIVDDISKVDDRAKANYMVNCGGDYWKNLTNTASGLLNPGIGMGRFRYIKNEWQTYNFHSLTEEQLANNPPPLK